MQTEKNHIHFALIIIFLTLVICFSICRGERQALRAAKDIVEMLDGEALFAYCSPYKRAIGTWDIIEDYIDEHNRKKNDEMDCNENSEKKKVGVEIIGMREEPRVAEQQFGNFRKCSENQCRPSPLFINNCKSKSKSKSQSPLSGFSFNNTNESHGT